MTAKIKLNAASGGGSISIQAPSSSSNNRVIALPDIADGTLVTSQSTLDATKLSGALPAISGASLTGISAGITQADSWRLNGGFNSSGANVVANNWERADVHFDKIGTGMAVDSDGKWTFPTTGIYLIDWQVNFEGGSTNYSGGYIDATANNSSYTGIAHQYSSIRNTANSFSGITCKCMFDVTDVTTHFVKLYVNSSHQVYVQYDGDSQRTGVTFIKLGDT